MITTKEAKPAFEYETGQYICHLYIDSKIDNPEHNFNCNIYDEFIKLVQDNPINDERKHHPWLPMPRSCPTGVELQTERQPFHLTISRGHYALYYNQIKPFVEALNTKCRDIDRFKIYLDELVIFENHEKTKRFLCLASHMTNEAFNDLRQGVQATLNDFASSLTQECYIHEAVPHCSLMWQEIFETNETCDKKAEICHLNQLIETSMSDDLCVIVDVESIIAKIGFKTYCSPLKM